MHVIRCALAGALLMATSCFAGAAAPNSAPPSAPLADKAAIKAHLFFLADDLLEGRETGSRGYDIAASYVASQFAQYGVLPKGAAGSYYQPVPLRSTRIVPGSASVELVSPGGVERLSDTSDFATSGSTVEDASRVEAPLVFAGYGISAPRFKHDDYARIDVKGKIVVVLQGKPASFPTEEGAHFGSTAEKSKLAAQHGAVGLVVLWTPVTEKAYSFDRLIRDNLFPAMAWLDAAGKPAGTYPGMQGAINMSMAAGARLFSRSEVKLEAIYALAAANAPLPALDLKLSLRAVKNSMRADLKSNNVVGMIEGSDPRLKHEYVVLSAHLDHIGQVREKTGDNIYNGAMDNASGIAMLLETARLFRQSGVKPRRSILFLALTAEEKGLLGSRYFAANPTVPLAAMVGNVNLDMPLLTFDFKDVIAFGAEHSSLKHNVERAVAKVGMSLMADPWPALGVFTRSDHYAFVREGVPAIFLVPGLHSFKAGEDGAKIWADFQGRHYHQPSDDLSLPFNFDAAARFAQINYAIALDIANATARPTWNQGDFFGESFRK
jgi:hypothetical protein